MAWSSTDRVMAPAVSAVSDIGMMPERLTRPKVGRMPTVPVTLAGERMDPVVSVPSANGANRAATAAADPLLDPSAVRSGLNGLIVWPPTEL
ncbi:hypothetical protein D3C71_1349700 [compost metagenome]